MNDSPGLTVTSAHHFICCQLQGWRRRYHQIRTFYQFVCESLEGTVIPVAIPCVKLVLLLIFPVACIIVAHLILDSIINTVANLVLSAAFYCLNVAMNLLKYSFIMLILVLVFRYILPENGALRSLRQVFVKWIQAPSPVRQVPHAVAPPSSSSTRSQLEGSTLREDECSQLCSVCLSEAKCVMLLPCRHLCLCVGCSEEIARESNSCPLCRSVISSTIQAYL